MSPTGDPYVDLYVQADDGFEIYVPVARATLNQARHIAAMHAEDTIPGFGRSRYFGKRDVPLHDHDEWEDCEVCPAVPVWVFETYEGTWRS